MERLAKRVVAATAGILVAASILLVVLYASVQGAPSGGSSSLAPSRSGGHGPPSGTAPQAPNTPSTPSSSSPPVTSHGCDHGQHKDQGKCVGHSHHGVGEGDRNVPGGD